MDNCTTSTRETAPAAVNKTRGLDCFNCVPFKTLPGHLVKEHIQTLDSSAYLLFELVEKGKEAQRERERN